MYPGLIHRHRPLPPLLHFVRGLARSAAIGSGVVVFSLGLGTVGYRAFAGLPWLDALLNAAMILTGMGPVDPLTTTGAKLFGVFFALFSGVVFLTLVAVLFAPVAQRFLHRFHLELYEEPAERQEP